MRRVVLVLAWWVVGCGSTAPLDPGWIAVGDLGLKAKPPCDAHVQSDPDKATVDLMSPEMPARIIVKRKEYARTVDEAIELAREYQGSTDHRPTTLANGWTLTWQHGGYFVVMSDRKLGGSFYSCESTSSTSAAQRGALEFCTSLAKR